MSPTISEELVDEAMHGALHADSTELVARIDAALQQHNNPADRGRLLLARATASQGDRPLAGLKAETIEAIDLLEQAGEYAMLANATTQLAVFHVMLDEIDEGTEQAVRAMVMLDELAEHGTESPAMAFANLATVFRFFTAFEMAMNYAQRAFDLHGRSVEDDVGFVFALKLADCALESAWHAELTSQIDVRDRHVAIACDIAERIERSGDTDGLRGFAHQWIAIDCVLLRDDLAGATSLVAFAEEGDVPRNPIEALAFLSAGVVALRRGRCAHAVDLFDSAEDDLLGDPTRYARLLRSRSEAHAMLGYFRLATRDAHTRADLAVQQQVRHVSSLIHQVNSRAEAEQSRLALAEKTDALTEQTRRDELTGVASRSWFDDRLRQRTSGAGNIAIVLIDVDNFKQINDQHSHVVGDEVLRQVGRILETASQEDDLVARYGGEEFVVLPKEGDLVKAHELGERLRKSIEAAPWHRIGSEILISVSVGVSVGPTKASADVFRAADDALYEAKAAGRNCVIAHRLGRGSRGADPLPASKDA